MRTIGVVTGGRSDYGLYRPILRKIQEDPELSLRLMVSGMHLAPEFGFSINEIRADGFEISDQVDTLMASDTPEGIAKSMGLGTIGFSQSFARFQPDILLVLGDRFDMYAAVIAALPFNIPIAHIHGGESTEGLIDEAIRHSMTKMSHLHFASTSHYRDRIIQMGEEPWRVIVSGAPGLDNIKEISLLSRDEISKQYGLQSDQSFTLVTFHPVTLEHEKTPQQMHELLASLEDVSGQIIFTYPNTDTCGRQIIQKINHFVEKHSYAQVIINAGTQIYFSFMKHAQVMVGNSSSGIIEAASFQLPVVNIGNRQRGRIHAENVLDVSCSKDDILGAIQKAGSSEFQQSLLGLANPYGDGHAAEKIVERLKEILLDERLLKKRFHELKEVVMNVGERV